LPLFTVVLRSAWGNLPWNWRRFWAKVRLVNTRAGVGYSENPDSEAAGTEAARAALERAGTSRADLVLLFSTAKHDQPRLLRSVRSAVGPGVKIVGGGASGVITNDRLGFEGCQVGVAVLSSESVHVHTFVQPGLAAGELEVGRSLGRQLREARFEGEPNLLLMYESVKASTGDGPLLNMGTPLLEGIEAALGNWPPVIGLGLLGDPRWKPGLQYFDDRLETQSALAVAFSGSARMDNVVINNLRPMSTYREITAAEGPHVLGIEGRPALEVLEELVGADLRWEEYPLTVTLGVNNGDKFGEFREEDYANYLCVAVDRERRALTMSDAYLRPGTRVQLMRRHMDFKEVRRRAETLVARVRERPPFLALYIDCAGRASNYVGTDGEEAEEIQRAIGAEVPLLGIYSGSEIGRVGQAVQRLNHAGILALLYE
jgi:hypothetical protein